MSLEFEITRRHGAARRGRLVTAHGTVATPAFMPVGTLGAVKGLAPWQLEEAGAQLMLANLYHLALRPGIDAIESVGGLHAFSGWQRPILTDSGGFQVFSLADLATIDRDGVTFRSHLDGAEVRFTPESVVEMQLRLGVDVAMMLDECLPWPVARAAAEAGVARTGAWARRARAAWPSPSGRALFGIVQGGVFADLRRQAAAELAELELDGYAIGGVSVGEPLMERRQIVEVTAPLLPEDRPRYLMGMGTPADLLHAVERGVDLFDCVIPTRNARHGLLYTRAGALQIKNARFRDDPAPIDTQCGCPTCRRVPRALVHHLLRAREVTGVALATAHNVRFYLDFMGELREAIASGTLSELAGRADLAEPESGAGNPPPESTAPRHRARS